MSQAVESPSAAETVAAFTEGLAAIRSRSESARTAMYQASGTGRSPDGAVSVRADAAGVLLGIRFGPEARRLEPRDLAESTMAALRHAQIDALRAAQQAVADIVGPDSPALAVLARQADALREADPAPSAGPTPATAPDEDGFTGRGRA